MIEISLPTQTSWRLPRLRYHRLVHRCRRLLSLVLCVSLGSSSMAWSATADAAAPARAGGEASQVSPQVIAQAKELYDRGKAKYETLDYIGAVELWTAAYDLLDDEPSTRAIRNNLVYNIAAAQQKAYELDGDVIHLRRAKGLLEKYVAEFKSLYAATPEGRAEIGQIEQRIAEIERQLGSGTSAAAPAEPATTAAPSPAAGSPAAPVTDAAAKPAPRPRTADILRSDPELWKRYTSARGMMIGGGVTLGLGTLTALISLSLMPFANAGTRRRVGPIVGVSVGLGAMAAGAVLLGIGGTRYRNARREAQQRVVVTPTVSREGFGVGAAVRF